ncbi:hypothetical protein [Oricola cellulosilytica]|uniref:4Fe-4S ferredoxin-type domain-containing protein n=1 Tax=Oricola cellulosilytica TaxID=1429082 RepID=A0A4R0PA26_9HYPH|nr:hypothetical protein [Oricola cellulosilytica]TCD13775.1 hypothetical protein E0D97_11755 [Oricola cellulosilytica]
MDIRTATRFGKRLWTGGFLAFGGFHPEPADSVPDLECGRPARTLLVIGNAGAAMWTAFQQAPEARDGVADPLDRYTRRVLLEVAHEFSLGALFPFDGAPWFPFAEWARKAGGFSPSPMGLLAHHRYGPWAGFRAAFISTDRSGTFAAQALPGPCTSCTKKPCITTCPAGALSLSGYDVPLCRGYLAANPDASCHRGCLARRACPVGTDFNQPDEMAAFHMRAFLG